MIFSWTGGVPSTQLSSGASNITYQAFPSGWYRISFTATSDAVNTDHQIIIYPDRVGTTGTLFTWGAQLEAATFASSYIPTTTAAVVRNADVLTYDASGNVSATAGTVYAEIQVSNLVTGSAARAILGLDDTSSAEAIVLSVVDSTNTVSMLIRDGSVEQGPVTTTNSVVANTPSKVAATYLLNNFAVDLDDGTVATDTSGTLPAVATIIRIQGAQADFSYPQLFGTIKNVRIWTSQLPNGELQVITT